ncbi:hypothetical protein [Chitinasiproducens palmae]|uniref:hypothetical protein n=1 Tax=Chitinasiproducens palmae TaxID=1770053 RepID=UPI0011142D79|nr:hypothetical protein [Chitinasiproducens palmae]
MLSIAGSDAHVTAALQAHASALPDTYRLEPASGLAGNTRQLAGTRLASLGDALDGDGGAGGQQSGSSAEAAEETVTDDGRGGRFRPRVGRSVPRATVSRRAD